jgi:hypothetical protein
MGTQGSITVYDEQGKDIANIVTQYDGYELSDWVARFVSGKQLTNGISNDYDFNGMGDLAARLIAALKNQRYKSDIGQPVKPGNVYLYDTPYETDYHITLVYQGEGKKPKMTVSTPEWTDNYYDRTVLPDVGEQNVQMQGAETFNAELSHADKSMRIWEMVQQNLNNPMAVEGFYATFFGEDKEYYDGMELAVIEAVKDLNKNPQWTDEMFKEYGLDNCSWCGEEGKKTKYLPSSTLGGGSDYWCEECYEDYEGGKWDAESFNSYKVAPELSSYTKEELIDSKAGPQGTDTYDEMEYDPIAQDRLSAEECSKCVVDRELSGLGKGSSIGFHTSSRSACPSWCINAQDRLSAEELFPPYAYDYSDEVKARVLNKILLWHENMQLQSDEIADRMDRILWMLDNPDKFWEDWDLHAKDMGYEGYDAESFASETSSTLKSIGYVAGTVGVGYLLFQQFLKDRLDETMNQ